MPNFRSLIGAEIDPANPVKEACAVINEIMKYHPGKEMKILQGIRDAIDIRLTQLQSKGADENGSE